MIWYIILWFIFLLQSTQCTKKIQCYIGLHYHDDVIKRKHIPRYWFFVQGIHRILVNSPHKGQWRRALMFSLICARINGWVSNHETGDLRCHHAHYDIIVMITTLDCTLWGSITVISHKHHRVWKHWSLNCFFNSFCKLTSKETSNLQITGSLWGKSSSDWWFPLTKGELCRKHFYVMLWLLFIRNSTFK